MKRITLLLGLLFLIGTNFAQATESQDKEFTIKSTDNLKFWLL